MKKLLHGIFVVFGFVGYSSDIMAAPCQSGNISADCSPIVDGVNIPTMSAGTVELMSGGSINIMTGGLVEEMIGGQISLVTQNASVGTMSDGLIGDLYGSLGTFSGGTINYTDGYASIGTMSNGSIGTMTGGTITNMESGSIDFFRTGTIINMNDGIINNIQTINNPALIVNMNGGTINTITGGVPSITISNMNAGTVDVMNAGTITNMAGGVVNTMNAGTVTAMNGGVIGVLNDSATITTINQGTLKSVALSSRGLDVASGGHLTIAGNTGETSDFLRSVNSGANATIEIKYDNSSYNFGDKVFTVGSNGRILVNGTDSNGTALPKLVYGSDGGFFEFASLASGYSQASISELAAIGSVVFKFDVNHETGDSHKLTIESSTSAENNHFVAVGANAGQSTAAHVEKIDLITDNSNSLNFGLTTGDYVGIGAHNYSLETDSLGGWSLVRSASDNNLSDAAKMIGSFAGAQMISVQTLQSTLNKRLGEIRFVRGSDVWKSWVRTYGGKLSFDDFSNTDVKNYGIEAGVDKQVMRLKCARLIFGVGIGMLNSNFDVSSHNSLKDGGGDTKMPYLGAYGTMLFGNGAYIDMVARYGYSDGKGHYYDGTSQKQTFSTERHVGILSTEIGYQRFISSDFLIEPSMQLSYSRIGSDKFRDDAGYRGKFGTGNSLQLDTGVLLRYEKTKIKPYGRLGFVYEFDGKTKIIYDGEDYKSDISGGRADMALGITTDVKDNLLVFGEIGYQKGAKDYDNKSFNLGVTYNF